MDSLWPVVQEGLQYVQEQPYTSLILTVLIICISTRLVTGQNATYSSSSTGSSPRSARLPPSAPYWVPYFSSLPQLASNGDGFLASLRKAYPKGIFSLNLLGKTHTVIYDPELTAALAEQPEEVVNRENVSKRLLQTNFGYPQSKVDAEFYSKLVPEMKQSFDKFASKDSLDQTIEVIATRLRHNIADFVTFNSNEVDQTQWERLSYAALIENAGGQQATEVELFDLVRNFVAFTASASLVGTDFIENFPDVWQPFWRFDDGFMSLAADVPAFLPVNKAIGARRARGMVLRCMDEFETALETHREGTYPGPQWADIDNVSLLIQERVDDIFRKHKLDPKKRASLDFSLLWGMNTTANPLIFWCLWRTYSDPSFLARLREEISPHMILEKPAVGFGGTYASSVRIEKLNIDGLLEKCPLLKSAVIETMRLDSGSWSFNSVQKDLILGSSEDAVEKWFLPAGTYVHAAHSLHHTSPNTYQNPQEYDAQRHLSKSKDGAHTIDPSKLIPLGKSPLYHPNHAMVS